MALKRLYFSKFSWEAWPRTPLEVLAPSARVGQIRVRSPKISKPVRLWQFPLGQSYRERHEVCPLYRLSLGAVNHRQCLLDCL